MIHARCSHDTSCDTLKQNAAIAINSSIILTDATEKTKGLSLPPFHYLNCKLANVKLQEGGNFGSEYFFAITQLHTCIKYGRNFKPYA